MSNFKTRLRTEFDELETKIQSLEAFLHGRDVLEDTIGEFQLSLLIVQLEIMKSYHTVLYRRLINLK